MDRKKELKELYKNMKPDMGIFYIRSNSKNKCFIDCSQNLNGAINGSRFRLNAGNHLNIKLQDDWKELGEKDFTIEILENLQYDKDESMVDYSEDLEILKMVCEERLSKNGMEFYK